METLRTPDSRFEDLPDYPFRPNYAEVSDSDGGSLRVHYLDEGPPRGSVVLLMHGEPSWSYLYRHMIPPLVAAGHRVIVPDLVGFGRSDKPTQKSDYTFARHVEWMRELLFDRLELQDINVFFQDWGSLIGLRLVGEHPARFARVAVGNGGLPTGDMPPGDAFVDWLDFSQNSPKFEAGWIVNGATTSELASGVVAAYDAPYPDDSYIQGARIFPSLVPISPDDPSAPANRAAWITLRSFEKPFLCAFSDMDPITRGGEENFIGVVPGAEDQPHATIEGAGHFLQEDRGPQLARVLVDWLAGPAR